MMLSFANPWLWLGALIGAIGLIAVGAGGMHHYDNLAFAKQIDKQKLDAQTLLTQAQASIAAKAQENAALNDRIEATHAKAESDISAARDDFNRQLASRVRVARCGPSGGGAGSAKAPDTGGGADAAAVSGLFVPEAAIRDIAALASAADELRAYAVACHEFAVGVGR